MCFRKGPLMTTISNDEQPDSTISKCRRILTHGYGDGLWTSGELASYAVLQTSDWLTVRKPFRRIFCALLMPIHSRASQR